MGQLDGKRIVVTGGTRGFGYAMARAFLTEGARVAICGRSEESVEHAVARLAADVGLDQTEIGGSGSGVRLLGFACDTRRAVEVEELAAAAEEAFGGFDAWVNNAGLPGPYGEVATIPRVAFEEVVDTNILGTYYGTLAALDRFLPRRAGKLVNITGFGGDGRPAPFQAAYGASKAWVQSFTLSVAKEHEGNGVGVFVVSPGMMVTDMMTSVEVTSEAGTRRLLALPRVLAILGEPPEVPAQLVVQTLSSATDGKTGLLVKGLPRRKVITKGLRVGLGRMRGKPMGRVPVNVVACTPRQPGCESEDVELEGDA